MYLTFTILAMSNRTVVTDWTQEWKASKTCRMKKKTFIHIRTEIKKSLGMAEHTGYMRR